MFVWKIVVVLRRIKTNIKSKQMNNKEFKEKIAKWLEEEGLCVLGTWDIEEIDEFDMTCVSVKIKINNIDVFGRSYTQNKEETIRTAVLSLNDQLLSKIANA